MRPAALTASVLLIALYGCQTGLPAGWQASNPTAWQNVAQAAHERVYGPEASTADPVPMLAACGRVGSAQYAVSTRSMLPAQDCAREAVRAMCSYCATLASPVDYTGLCAAIRAVCGVKANDTDQCIGLMVAAKRAAPT